MSLVGVGQGDTIWIQGSEQEDDGPGANLIIDGGPSRGERNRLIKGEDVRGQIGHSLDLDALFK